MFNIEFHPEASLEILALEDKMQAKLYLAIEKLESQGNELRYPHTDIIKDGLFELRAGSKDITRTFFAFAKGKRIFILRTFIKKTKKIPKQEIILAIKRLEELTNEN